MNSTDGHQSRLSYDEWALGLRVLAEFVSSGLTPSRAVAALAELENPGWKRVAPVMSQHMAEGLSLATAAERSVAGAPRELIALLRTADAGAGMHVSLRLAAELAESTLEARRSIASALAYPAILLGAGVASIVVIATVVLPRLLAMVTMSGAPIPPLAALLFALLSVVQRSWETSLVCGIALLGAGLLARDTHVGRRALDRFLVRVPVLGPMRLQRLSAQVAALLGAFLEAGAPLRVALQHTAHSTGEAEVSARLRSARERILTGERVSRALAESQAVTPLTLRLIQAGELTGELSTMLRHAARMELLESQRRMQRLVKLLEPVLVLGLAVVIGGIAMAMLQTVYAVRA